MIYVRRSQDRGQADHGWLRSQHTFSFADYHDPKFMGFGTLRVINEDRINGGTGFSTHPHRDMEIVSYVITGGLKHQDSMGNSTVIKPGEVQRMSAGTGIRHSEHNLHSDQLSHFLQVWILPAKIGIEPAYGQKSFAEEMSQGKLILVASQTGRDGSVSLNQDTDIYALKSPDSGAQKFATQNGRKYWLQVISGQVNVDTELLLPGDGAAIEKTEGLSIKRADGLSLEWSKGSEFLLFDMP